VVAALLRPGGRLFIREGHPMLWALADERPDGLLAVELPYFEGPGTDFYTAKTYVDHDEDLRHPQTHEFNHGLAEIFNALMRAGMRITAFDEHDSVPWPAQGSLMVASADGEYRLRDRPRQLPCSYTLQAVKAYSTNPGVAPS
jgi:hypothetical protein